MGMILEGGEQGHVKDLDFPPTHKRKRLAPRLLALQNSTRLCVSCRLLHGYVEQDLRSAIQLYLFSAGDEHSIGSQLQVFDPQNSSGLLIQDRY